jgi:PAS domain S-box-containing protein
MVQFAADNPWLGAHERDGLGDFLMICGPQFERLHVIEPSAEPAGSHGDVGFHAPAGTPPPTWDRVHAILERYAVESPLRRSIEEAHKQLHAASLEMLGALTAAYGHELGRFVNVLRVLNAAVHHGMRLLAGGYLSRQQEEADERQEDLATTLDSIGDAVVVTDARGVVVRMNPVAERLTGFTRGEALGRSLNDVFRIEHETTAAPVENPVARVLAEGTVVGLANHTVLVSKHGERCPIADSGAPIRGPDGKVRGVVLVFRDVSEERRAQLALEHWERIFQHATWGVAVASAGDVRFRAVNPAYASMHGYTVDELMGQPVSTLWAPETQADMHRHANETHDHGRLVVETTHMTKVGERLPVEIVATTIKNSEGEVEWFVANVQDITERKRLQQSRLRAVELEAENRRVEEANRLKSEFLASMSHELRTPLNSIIGFAELLHDEQVGPMPERQREFLLEILTGGRHLLRLINDVLDLAKVEAGKIELRPEPVELKQLVDSVAHGLRAAARDRELSVRTETGNGLVDIVVDPGRFKQVLYNYLSNALKFTPDGGEVFVRVLEEGSTHFRIEVEDTGVGIDEADLERLFVAFQQLDSGLAKRQGGTGLGLALTKRIVEAQGGSVGMLARPGGGSIFFATLPRRPVAYALPEGSEKYSGSTAILVVDGDPDRRRLLSATLREAGYDVEAVANCDEAGSALSRRAYAAVVVDLLEGEADAVGLLIDAVHSRDGATPVPVIALSLGGSADVATGFAVSDVLSKPVGSHELVAALKRSGVEPSSGRPIVVIDDDPGSLKLMAATLTQLGHEAVCFASARAALSSLGTIRPSAIVLDLIMPDMDGLGFLDRFRAWPENRDTPVMIWTVKDLSADERASLRSTVSSIVQKGVQDGSRLAVALQAFLGRSAEPLELQS